MPPTPLWTAAPSPWRIDRAPRDPHSMRVAIITVSDSAARGEREDKSGPAVEKRCRELGWNPVAKKIVADDLHAIRDLLIQLADSAAADLILTTGGTGIGPRDITPEATSAAAEKLLSGLRRKNPRRHRPKFSPRLSLARNSRSSRPHDNSEFARKPQRRSRMPRRSSGPIAPRHRSPKRRPARLSRIILRRFTDYIF